MRPPEPAALCRFEGLLPYGELLDATSTYTVARGTDLPVEMGFAPGPTLSVLGRAEGYELQGRLAPELHVVAPTRLGPVLYVGARHGVGVVDVSPEGVRIGPRRFLADELTFPMPAETTVRCEDLALPGIENTDPDADREAFGLSARGERMLVVNQAIEVREGPGGEVAAILVPSPTARSVALLDEREGTVRIAYHHWTDGFVVGWVDSALVLPAAEEGMGGILGGLGVNAPEDFTVCRVTTEEELFVLRTGRVEDDGTVVPLGEPAPFEHLGTVQAGTALIRMEELGDGWVSVRPLPTSILSVPPGVVWAMRAEGMSGCAEEHYEPPSLGALFR